MDDMSTIVTSIPLEDALEIRLQNLCDLQYAAGYRLAAMAIAADVVLLVFQKM
jgi:site-specific recombinase XerC